VLANFGIGTLATVQAVLDRRLRAESRRPVAVAFSGGGDSLALLLEAAAWAKRAGRELLVLTVDHRLQPESEAWTAACAATAARLGLVLQALAWTGEKPVTGLSAAARAARHRLLADAARAAGASVILMGHTADDILEARLMRARGSTTPDPREWSPSPAWPQGRGIFLLRPLLGVRRSEIRDWLAARGEAWIDDPANESRVSARARARRDLALGAAPPDPQPEGVMPQDLARASDADAGGGLRIARTALRAAASDVAARFVSAACLCAAGTDRPPAGPRALRLVERLLGSQAFTATLAGARVEADEDTVHFLREAGEAARGGLRPLSLKAGETGVWDGRFEVTADRPMQIRPAAGLRSQLSPTDQQTLAALPARARDVMAVAIDDAGRPMLIAAKPLALDRLLAACGVIVREPA
jgi:tRNA(Ile)-lysidine synthase